jgi:hypothetical protein
MAELSDMCSDCQRVRMTEKQKKQVANILKYFTGDEYDIRGQIITPPSDCTNAITLTMQIQKTTESIPEKGRNQTPKKTYENTVLAEKRYCAFSSSILGEEK